MADSPLELSRRWKKQFNEATALIEAAEYEQAIEKLNETLATIEALEQEGSTQKGGDRDLRVPETLERLGYAYYKRGLLSNAESVYRQALEMLENRIIGYSTAHACARSLADILAESGKNAEAEQWRVAFPVFELEDTTDPFDLFESIESSLLITLSNLANQGKETKQIISIMEDLVAHMENYLGTKDPVTVNGLLKVGSICLHYDDKAKAIALMSAALRTALSTDNCEPEELCTCMRKLALCEPHLPLSKALTTKATAIEKETGATTLAGNIAALLESMSNAPKIEMSIEDADRIIQNWKDSFVEESIPFVAVELTEKQRYEQLVSLIKKALVIEERCHADESHPLSRINLLSEASKCYVEMGDIENAKLYKQKEVDVISEHWGEGHLMMLEALEELEEM